MNFNHSVSKVFLAAVLAALPVAAGAACPVTSTTDVVAKITQAIEKSGGCREGALIAEACAFGDAKDMHVAGAAYQLCQSSIQGLSAEDAKTWAMLEKKCSDKYDTHNGTAYRSYAAYCRLNVAKLFADLYEPIDL